jgi:hypothetical protein
MTREQWLLNACAEMEPWLKEAGAGAAPDLRVSVGWPLGRKKTGGKGSHAIGQCFDHVSSKDGRYEIFISPELAEPTRVCDVLLHELVHAYVGLEAKHGKDFKLIATRVGLTGKMTATVASDILIPKLKVLVAELGGYPHAELGAGVGLTPKQGTRLLKAYCPRCGYVVRITRKWADVGLPVCPIDKGMRLNIEGEEGVIPGED